METRRRIGGFLLSRGEDRWKEGFISVCTLDRLGDSAMGPKQMLQQCDGDASLNLLASDYCLIAANCVKRNSTVLPKRSADRFSHQRAAAVRVRRNGRKGTLVPRGRFRDLHEPDPWFFLTQPRKTEPAISRNEFRVVTELDPVERSLTTTSAEWHRFA